MALSLLLLCHANTRYRQGLVGIALAAGRWVVGGGLDSVSAVVGDNGEDGALKDFVHTEHFLAAAFHVLGVHLLGDGHALVGGDGGEALRLEHVDAGSLVAQV